MLRPYRIEDAPNREYFRLPIKSGTDLVEQVLYADSSDEPKSAQNNAGEQDKDGGVVQVQDQDSGVQAYLGGAPKKKRVVMCVPYKKLQYTVSDVQTTRNISSS